jgi:hypothetical protein
MTLMDFKIVNKILKLDYNNLEDYQWFVMALITIDRTYLI